MQHKIIKPDKDFELEIQDKNPDTKSPHTGEEIDKANIYWLACAYQSPFMPMIDLTFAFNELKKMVKNWLPKKKKDTSFIKKD